MESQTALWRVLNLHKLGQCQELTFLAGHVVVICLHEPGKRGSSCPVSQISAFFGCFAESFCCNLDDGVFHLHPGALAFSASGITVSPRLQGRQCPTTVACVWCDGCAMFHALFNLPLTLPLNTRAMFVGGSWFYFIFSSFSSSLSQEWLTADSALHSFLQTETTDSPVREQSERKMKNNIRKEPFGKPNKKCYIKINTRAWPFVVLYILKPPIDSLLITCLFYFTDTSLGRL